jgi:hypothetical protein
LAAERGNLVRTCDFDISHHRFRPNHFRKWKLNATSGSEGSWSSGFLV